MGPNRIDGSSRASITPATAVPPTRAPPASLATSEATATKHTQSPRDDSNIACHRREKEGWVSRSLRVAGLVPRRRDISSATRAMALAQLLPELLVAVSRVR